MGQYFKLVNEDKREVVVSYHLGGTAKFKEWLYNNEARVLVWLLRRSNESGGGDVDLNGYDTLGRWAGDRVVLIGDYDESGLYDAAEHYTDISERLRKEYDGEAAEDGVLETMGLS